METAGRQTEPLEGKKAIHSDDDAHTSIKEPVVIELCGGRPWSLKTLTTIQVPERRDAVAKDRL